MNIYYKETKSLAHIALPLTLSGLIEASIAFSSTLFLAHLGTLKLAAGALASWLFITLMVVLWGTLTSISVLVARFNGADDQAGISRTVIDGLLLATVLSLPGSLIIWHGAIILQWFGQSPAVVLMAQSYLHGLTLSVFPDLIMLVLLQLVLGLEQTRINLFFTVLWVPLNIILNYLLIFGRLGFPKLDIGGIGWGTSCTFWITTLLLSAFLLSQANYRRYFNIYSARQIPSQMKNLLILGVPMGMMYALEIAFFFVITLLMGRINYIELAAHQLVMQYFWLISVIISCIAQAVTIRISYSLGNQQTNNFKAILFSGITLSIICMSIIGLFYWLMPESLLGIDIDIHSPSNMILIKLAKNFFILCAIFQLLESMRFIVFGALRGLNDTRFTLLCSLFTFWGVALPVGYWLAFCEDYAGTGLWIGIILSALCGMLILYQRFLSKNNRVIMSSKPLKNSS